MEDWVGRALAKWPNVPALFGWLGLDRRGRWLIRGEIISRPQIIDTINPNYACDEHGRWYFQNGPQRGYVTLEYTPLVLRTDGANRLLAQTGAVVAHPRAASLDEQGALTLDTGFGAGVIDGGDLDWTLTQLRRGAEPIGENDLQAALALPSGAMTQLTFEHEGAAVPVMRLDAADMPQRLGFVREPKPLPAEADKATG